MPIALTVPARVRRLFHRLPLLILGASALLSTPAIAADDGTDLSETVLKNLQTFVVHKDGSFVETEELLVQLNEQRAIDDAAQRQFHFNNMLEDVEILEAYTEKPDGRRIPVSADQIKLQQEPAYSGAPMFQDMQVETLIYGDVAVGDKLYSKIRRTRRVAMFAGQFSDVTYPWFRPTKQLTLVYDVPASMPLQADNLGFKAAAPLRQGERIIYRWDDVPAENPRIENGAVDYWDFGRHLLVSTFDDYAALGLAYDRAAAPAAIVSPRIEAVAHDIVGGLGDPRARAFAIDDWVRKNIRYVAVYIGNGGIVPHAAQSVLDNRYGDCKDHATLMEALLRAAGIDSTPALINAGSSYKLSPVASLGQFNHVITYVPTLKLYLDSTADNIGAGYLPAWDLDKQTILTHTGTLGRTPVSQAATIRNRFSVRIAVDGSAGFEFTRDQGGEWEEIIRVEQQNWKKADQATFVENLLKSRGIKGAGDVELGDLSEAAAGRGYRYTLRGQADNWVYLPGTVGIPADSSLYAGLAQQVFGLTSEATRTQPFVCPVNDYDEEATYAFPDHATLLAVPPDVHVASAFFQYDAVFKREDGKLVITRRFKSGKDGSRVCTPADYASMRADIKNIVRDLRSQFILQVAEPQPVSASPD